MLTYSQTIITTISENNLEIIENLKNNNLNQIIIGFLNINHNNCLNNINDIYNKIFNLNIIILLNNQDILFIKNNRKNIKYIEVISKLLKYSFYKELIIDNNIKYLLTSANISSDLKNIKNLKIDNFKEIKNKYDGRFGQLISISNEKIKYFEYSIRIEPGQIYKIDKYGLTIF